MKAFWWKRDKQPPQVFSGVYDEREKRKLVSWVEAIEVGIFTGYPFLNFSKKDGPAIIAEIKKNLKY
jgi:hypothetical protein